MSRPSDYSDSLADAICLRIMEGESLRRICADADMPDRTTVYRWMAAHEDFATKCVRARTIQADFLEEEMTEIEDGTLSGEIKADAARVVLSSKQWRASKLAPKKYGDKLELAGDPANPLHVINKIERVIVRPTDTDA